MGRYSMQNPSLLGEIQSKLSKKKCFLHDINYLDCQYNVLYMPYSRNGFHPHSTHISLRHGRTAA